NGSVFWHDPNYNSGGWNYVPNICAKDLSAGANGSVWFVTCTPDNDGSGGGFKVGMLTAVSPGVVGVQEGAGPTHATRIAVAPEGTPWIVNTLGDVYYRISQDPTVVGWGFRGGIKALDISISSHYIAYATGSGANAGRIYVRNDQPSATNTPAKAE